MTVRWEKMSKSKNNGVSVDEVTNCVAGVHPGWCFIDINDNHVNPSITPVYRSQKDGFYYTHMTRGNVPLFLIERCRPSVLPDLVWKDSVVIQLDQWKKCGGC